MSTTHQKMLAVSVALNVAVCGAVGSLVHQHGGMPWLTRKFGEAAGYSKAQNTQASVYDCLPTHPDDTVFLGDSGINFGRWSELMNDPHCLNRGIPGDTTADVLGRLAAAIAGKPRQIVLWVGTNDIQKGRSPREAADGILAVIRRIRTESPSTKICVFPLLPVNRDRYSAYIVPRFPGIHRPDAGDVRQVNALVIESLSGDHAVSAVAADDLLQDNQIKPQYTFDGLHLNGPGLVVASRLIKAGM